MPKYCFATYGKIVCEYKPHKFEKNRSRLVVGGDKIDYLFELSTPTADITAFKCLINSVLSTPKAKFMTFDIKDFYLNTLMKIYEYMKLPINLFPPEIVKRYDLLSFVHYDEHIYMEIQKGMYGLPQAGRLANDQLKKHLQKYGYIHSNRMNRLWTHQTLDAVFTLLVDNFGIKCTSKENASHLIHTLKDVYRITLDWTGRNFMGIDLQWNYKFQICNLSMPGYQKGVRTFQA